MIETGRKLEVTIDRDPQRAAVWGRCCVCGGELFAAQRYYATADGPVCPACLGAYARAYFLPVLRAAAWEPRP